MSGKPHTQTSQTCVCEMPHFNSATQHMLSSQMRYVSRHTVTNRLGQLLKKGCENEKQKQQQGKVKHYNVY